MFDRDLNEFIDARTNNIDVTKDTNYRRIEAEKKLAAKALEPLFNDVVTGKRLLEEFENVTYLQALLEVAAAYKQGFLDGMEFKEKMAVLVLQEVG